MSSSYSLRSKGKSGTQNVASDVTKIKKRTKKSEPKANSSKKITKTEDSIDKGSKSKKNLTEKANSKKKQEKEEAETLERGFIYFFYKPKEDLKEAKNLDDVQRLFIVLWPQGHIYKKGETPKTTHNKKRIIAIPKKSLPDESKHTRFFGFVQKVSENLSEIQKDLNDKEWDTKTAHHHLESARPVGEGLYSIIQHGTHTHLCYVLEIPQELGKVQKDMHIEKESSMIITVKNTENFPSHLQKVFGNRKWNPANPTELLDQENAQIVLIGASDDLVAELGKVGEDLKELAEIDSKKITDDKLFRELHLSKAEHPPEPLLKGEYK